MTASLIPTPVMQFFDSNGDPLVGGKVYTYAAGTSTPLATYTDQGGATPNANPVILDSRGEAAIWFGGSSYKLVLKTSVDVLIWTADNVTAALASLAASTGSSLIGFIQAGAGAVATTIQDDSRQRISALQFMSEVQRNDVLGFTGSVDISSAWANARDEAYARGGTLYSPPGKYRFDTAIQLANGVIYQGAGRSPTLGTRFVYTGVSDAFYVSNPSNSSTRAEISIRDLNISCNTRTAGKASFADNGSTFLTLSNVGVSGNDYGIILDQSELVDIELCDIELPASAAAGIWIVNGEQRTVGNSGFYSNRIAVRSCQFNGSTSGSAIADDGGYAHDFLSNNYNGLAKHLRISAVGGLNIIGGESESAATHGIHFAATKLAGGAATRPTGSATIQGLLFANGLVSGAIEDIQVDASSLFDINLQGNVTNHVGSPFVGLNNCTTVTSKGNTNIGAGDNFYAINNYWDDIAWTPNLKFGAAQVGMTQATQLGRVSRRGKQINLKGRIDLTAKGSSAGTAEIYGVPYAAQTLSGEIAIGSPVYATNMAAGLTQLPLCSIASGGTVVTMQKQGAGTVANLTDTDFAATSIVVFQIDYETTNQIN